MRTTLALDDTLVAKAQAFTGLTEKSALRFTIPFRCICNCLEVVSPHLSLY